jgi:MFS family permease
LVVSIKSKEKEKIMGLFSSLNREQKEAIGLLQIGTFLEYFDLMLYVHMAVLLNELFFPKTDPHTTSLLAALAFCSTYIFRPIGALIFGWLGDNIGRKSTIIITTVIMSISCIVMASLPTYAQIGIAAAWIVTFCRIAQGMSSMGEMIGAEIYLTESIRRPVSYPAVASLAICANLGGLFALGVAVLATSYSMNWRAAFLVGAAIAIIGSVARTRLRETPDFLELKRRQMRKDVAELNCEEGSENTAGSSQQQRPSWKERIRHKTLFSYLLIACGWPLSFYLAFFYFTPILKEDFGYSAEDIITRNFFLYATLVASVIFWVFLSSRIHPLKIIKVRGIFSCVLLIALPFLIANLNSPVQLFLIQVLLILLPLDSTPADAALIYHLPIYRRFTLATFLYALSRALMYIITSFGLVYLGNYWGSFGLWFITLPVAIGYLYGILYFESLERKLGIYPNLS